MTIVGLSEQRRLGRDFKVRLGVRLAKATKERADKDVSNYDSYPKEMDYFVLDEAPEDVQAEYGPKAKTLRIMLPFEWNTQTLDGDDLVFSLYNRAYGSQKGLKCRGTGRSAEFPGTAITTDERWAERIAGATEQPHETVPSQSGETRYRVRCLGRDCPKYLHKVQQPDPQNPARTKEELAPGHDKDASCRASAILRAELLYSTTDPKNEHYCESMGVMELATGSVNSIIDLQSDFDMLKGFTGGRTAGIPITLVRKPTTTFRPVRQVHHTCALKFNHREVQRWAMVPVSQVFLSEEQRAVLKQLQAQPLGLTVDSVRDLVPARLLPAATLAEIGALTPAAVGGNGEQGSETAEAVAGVSGAPDGSTEPDEQSPLLVQAQIDELKRLAGGTLDPEKPYDATGNPWRAEALARLSASIKAMNEERGTEVARFSQLRVSDHEWLAARLRALPALDSLTEDGE